MTFKTKTLIAAAAITLTACTADQIAQTTNILSTSFNSLGTTGLTQTQITNGLKEALKIGTTNVASNLGQANGFLNKSDIRIPLPASLEKAKNLATLAGFGNLANDLELKMNRAAEASMPVAKDVFLSAISTMTLDDALGILNGGNTAATDFFKARMTPELTSRITPIVEGKLSEVGALQTYNNFTAQYRSLPLLNSFIPDAQQGLTTHAVEKTLAGAFTYLAREEAEIRANPAARTTALLRKVFAK